MAVAGAIWVLSSLADTPGPPLHHPLDWGAHFLSYLALGYALGRATGLPVLAWMLAAWWGAADEIHQAFVPGREAGITDWWFDLAGSGLGAWLAGQACLKRAARRRVPHGDEGAGPRS
ncbi:hypothetical protein ASF71_15410 [Deinococcus sp. Leaf326]|nr:hypothetical protein ASF71_15410 [Deinococcus sp. Leaf326]